MKKTIFFNTLLIATFISSIGFCQLPGVSLVTNNIPEPILGLKVGGNFNKLSTSGSELAKNYTPSFLPGIFGGLRKGNMGLRVELIMNFAKYDYRFESFNNNPLTSGTFNNIYLDIPLMIEYKVMNRVMAQAGLQFSRTLSVQSVASGNTASLKDPQSYFQPNSYSLVVGAEARLPLRLTFGARYILGFTDLTTVNLKTYYNVSNAWNARTAQLYVGFRFLGSK